MAGRFTLIILIAALICGAAIRAADVFSKPVFYHDESHTYQAATGHVGETANIIYNHAAPYATWVPASEWKRLLRPDHAMDFALIGRDALAYDVHPPLYYWLLHLVCLALGTHLWTGTLLNSALDLLTIFALYRFARYVIGDRVAAATAAFVWATTAGALQVAVVEARMYSLLTLLAVLFIDQFARFQYDAKARWWRLPLMAILTAAGALTHHHFGLLLAGAFGWRMIQRRSGATARTVTTRKWPRWFASLGAVAVGYATLVIVHPVFFGTGYKHLSDTHVPDAAGLAARGRQALEALSQFLVERRYGAVLPFELILGLACVAPAILLLAAGRAWWLRSPVTPSRPTTATETSTPETQLVDPRIAGFAIGVGCFLMLVTLALYLIGVTPAHAMSARYLAMSWPFVAIGVGLLVGRRAAFADSSVSAARRFGIVAICAMSLAAGAISAALQWRAVDWHPGAARADQLVRNADRVIIDNVGRGHFPRPMWRLKDDARVVVALPNDLLRTSSPWRKELMPQTVYISPAKSSEGVREKIVQSFGKVLAIEYVGHLYGIGDVYLLGDRKTPSPSSPRPRPASKPSTRPATQPAAPATEPADGVSGTFSIIAVDPETGVVGAAVASKYPAVGRVVPYVRAGVGAFATQHWHRPPWGEKALDLLAAGKTPEQVLATLLDGDKDAGKRQLAILDAKGRGAQRHCDDADPSGIWWGGASGRFYCCQGNTLTGREVVEGMAHAYEQTRGSMADRLMSALVAGDQAGGDHRGRLAAGVKVAKPGVEGNWFELYVDKSDDAVNELLKQYQQTKHEAKGQWDGKVPPTTQPATP